MTQINSQVNQYQQPLTGINATQVQNVGTEKISSGISSNPIVKNLGSEEDKNKWVVPTLFLPLFAAVSYGMKKFTEKCRGEYDKSWLGKIGNFGDRIGNTKFMQSSVVKGIENGLRKTKSFLNEKIINKSKILHSIFRTPAQPTVSTVLLQQKGPIAEFTNHALEQLKEYTKEGKDKAALDRLGISKDKFEELMKAPHTEDATDEVMKMCDRVIKNEKNIEASFKVSGGFKLPWGKKKHITEVLPFTEKVFGEKTIHFAEHLNKLKALKGTGNTHWLGRMLPKAVLKGIESVTFGNTGGKIGLLMAIGFLASSIKDTINAPKGEKGKTFAERNIYNAAFYLTMPLALNTLYGAAGLQYIGMSKEDVAKYREKLNAFNEKAKNFGFKDKAEWKAEAKELDKMLKGNIVRVKGEGFLKNTGKFLKNLIYKPLKFIGRTINVGNELKQPFLTKESSAFARFFKKIGYGFKYGAGYPMRFILAMFVVAPPLAELGAKMSHAIFGKPTKSVLDEGKEEEKKVESPQQAASQAILTSPPQLAPNAAAPTTPQVAPTTTTTRNIVPNQAGESLLQAYKSSSASKVNTEMPKATVRSYVPSPEGVKIKADSNTQQAQYDDKVSQAMSKAERAEQEAMKYLNR